MDPSIMKLLEEDVDESMHSGADVEAFTAALNRDLGGDTLISHPSDSENALSQGRSLASNQFVTQWQTSHLNDKAVNPNQQDLKEAQQLDQHSYEVELKQHGTDFQNLKQPDDSVQDRHNIPQNTHQQPLIEEGILHAPEAMDVQTTGNNFVPVKEQIKAENEESESQSRNFQNLSNQPKVVSGISNRPPMPMGMMVQQAAGTRMSNQLAMRTGFGNQQSRETILGNQQAMTSQAAVNSMKQGKQIPFARLFPIIQPQLDKDRAMQLQTLYAKLRKNEISKDDFVRHIRSIIGDQMLKMAVYKVQSQAESEGARSSQTLSGQIQTESQSKMPSTVQLPTKSSNSTTDSNSQKLNDAEYQGLNKQQQHHLHFSQAPFPSYGNTGNNHPFSASNVNTMATSIKQPLHGSQIRQPSLHQSTGATHLGSTTQGMNMATAAKFDRPASFSEPKRTLEGNITHFANSSTHSSVLASSIAHVTESFDNLNDQKHRSPLSTPQGLSSFSLAQNEHGSAMTGTVNDESFESNSSRMGFSIPMTQAPVTSAVIPGTNAKAPLKKPSVGQKKPLEALGSSPPSSSKKQKVSGGFSDQSIEQLNDVTAVSGVNLREEEEQLLSGSKEDSRVSEASRRVVQEEEERLILQKLPLQKKLAEIVSKCSLSGISSDVERCLSLCVEERMRGIISCLIRMSKQRNDIEKPRHRTIITSDVRQQIMAINKKAREEWERNQAEAEKLGKPNDPEGESGAEGDKDRDEGRGKSVKVNKEEDDKMRTTAANVAARAAVGGDDMLSKWQLMAEQARQKREGIDPTSTSQHGRDMTPKPQPSVRNEGGKRGHSGAITTHGGVRKTGRNQVASAQNRVVRSISVKDVIAVLEREPQMSKSTLMYRLYDKVRSDAAGE